MSICVVIPTLNEESTILKLLADLNAQTVKADEIIVVDGGSDDMTCELVKEFKNVKLTQTHSGTAHQRNLGASKTSCTHLLFLDADVDLNTIFIERLSRYINTHGSNIVCPWYIPLDGSLGSKIVMTFFSFTFWLTQKIQASGAGPCILVEKRTYDKVKGFDESVLHDDIEFIRRTSKVGKFAIAPIVCNISDRRFKKEGVLQVLKTYIILGAYFVTNNFNAANKITYDMSGDRYT